MYRCGRVCRAVRVTPLGTVPGPFQHRVVHRRTQRGTQATVSHYRTPSLYSAKSEQQRYRDNLYSQYRLSSFRTGNADIQGDLSIIPCLVVPSPRAGTRGLYMPILHDRNLSIRGAMYVSCLPLVTRARAQGWTSFRCVQTENDNDSLLPPITHSAILHV
ncbi:hypothetical protein EDB86DRAFT_2930405 [Lactarius hatsudake]|nr:hypothetical protein EDB86DRAFT_2930405 [Lactarius hatsudake]